MTKIELIGESMLLLILASASLFGFFEIAPQFHGPVGVAFEISISILGAISLINWFYDKKRDQPVNAYGGVGAVVWDQVVQVQMMPRLFKLIILISTIGLPLVVEKLMHL